MIIASAPLFESSAFARTAILNVNDQNLTTSGITGPMDNQTESRLYWGIYLAGLLWTLYLCLFSDGVLLHDELGHFLVSENAWNYPQLMLDLWGRSVNTIIYMIPSRGGLPAARLFSLLLAGITVLLTASVARKSGVKRLYLVPLFLWFQPWFNNFSYNVITEVPFSFLMILGVFLWKNRKEKSASIVFGLLPLVRHEGIALTILWSLYMLYRKKWTEGGLSLLPLVAYNLTYYFVLRQWPFEIFLDPTPTRHYGTGSWFHFFPRLAYRAGIPIAFLLLFSVRRLWELREKELYLILYLVYFITHVIIFRFGLFASGGYTIFLLPLAPAIAIAAALGAERILQYLPGKLSRLFNNKKVADKIFKGGIIIYLVSIIGVGLSSRPFKIEKEAAIMHRAARWLDAEGFAKDKVIATHVWFVYYFDLPWRPGERWDRPPQLRHLPHGSIVVWDRRYSELWELSLAELSNPENGWRKLREFGSGFTIIFQKI